MKMESFLGFRVRLDLQDGALMEGIISSLDEPRQLITLSDVTCCNAGKTSKFPGLLEVYGGDVVNLEILPSAKKKDTGPMDIKKNLSRPDSSASRPDGRPGSHPVSPFDSPAKNSGKNAWLAASGPGRSKKEDLAALKKEDFDFQGNLQLFDKQAIFSQIQAEDPTSLDQRLVSHNLSGKGQQLKAEQAKMKHTESVLNRPLEDTEQEERILPLRSPILMMQTRKKTSLTFKTENGMVIDPSSSSSPDHKYLWVQVDEAGKSLASYLADQSPKAVEFFCGSNSFLDAVIFCAARHLTMSGIHASILSATRNVGSGDIGAVLAQHKAFYEQVLCHMSPPLLLAHDETLIVNGLKRDFDRPTPPTTHLVSLDHVSTNQSAVLFFSMTAISEQAEALEALHPRTDIYWLNSAQLQDPLARQVFTNHNQDKGFSPYIRLRPFVR